VVLDRFMKQRVLGKGIPADRIIVLPPWSHDDAVCFDEGGRRDFRDRHNLAENFVVMYSGNHSPCHPLDTLLEAALRLGDQKEIAFCFVGGGSEQTKVEAFAKRHQLETIKCLPYQPLNKLSGSLSAADLHTVVMGDAFPGIVHPCKVYNVLAVGRPFMYIGPTESHITEIASQSSNGLAFYSAQHGEVDRVVAHIVAAVNGKAGKDTGCRELAGKFARNKLLPQMVELLEA
jgi:colanic acid biosynthesis glycosyl transferase WcaI